MKAKSVSLFSTKITLLYEPVVRHGYIRFNFSYFDQEPWKTAYIDTRPAHVSSIDICYGTYAEACLLLFALEAQYIDGPAVLIHEEKMKAIGPYAGCLNHIFGTSYLQEYPDLWAVYEMLRWNYPKYIEKGYEFEALSTTSEDLVDIYVVMYGSDGIPEPDADSDGKLSLAAILRGEKKFLEEFKRSDNRNKDRQVSSLLEMLCHALDKEILPEYRGNKLFGVMRIALLCFHAPASTVKMIAEVYGLDFWFLWNRVKDVLNSARSHGNIPVASPISVQSLLGLSNDEMIIFWTRAEPVEFSSELKQWLESLKERFDSLMEEGFDFPLPVRRVFKLLKRAEEIYCKLYAFASFMEEFLDNVEDRRYLALWKIFEEMVDKPENIKGAEVGEADPKYPWMKVYQTVRVPMQRYLALVANRELREEVLGF